MYKSRPKTWLIFSAWIILALLAFLWESRHSRHLVLLVFLGLSVIAALLLMARHYPPNFRFEWIREGVVRSRFGFEVRASATLIQYAEGERTVSWQPSLWKGVASFHISEDRVLRWDDPFHNEALDQEKKTEIVRAVKAALVYFQLVEAGKIVPKKKL